MPAEIEKARARVRLAEAMADEARRKWMELVNRPPVPAPEKQQEKRQQ